MKKIASALLLCALLVPMFLVASAHAATYTIVLLDPIGNRNIFYGGAVIDVKFQLFLGSSLITDATATLTVDGAPAVGRGQFNMDNFFAIKNQNYVFKLDTKPLSAGFGSPLHVLVITASVDGEIVATASTSIALH